jgi:hypothetical protein
MLSHIPPHRRGALRAIVTTREAGMRWTWRRLQTNGADTYGQVVWSRRPGAGVKPVGALASQVMGAKKPVPKEITKQP